MLQPAQYYSANDNAPLRQPRHRHTFGKSVSLAFQKTADPIKTRNRMSLLGWCLPLFAALFGVFALWQNLPLAGLLWPSAIFAVLLCLTAAQAKRDSRLRNISGLLLSAAVTIALTAFLSQNGFTLIAVEVALVLSAVALLVGWIFNSTPSILLSALSALLYLASFYPQLGLTTGIADQISQLGAVILPGLIVGQIIVSQKVRTSLAVFAAICAGYIWLETAAGDIPQSAMAGLMFVIAAAQFCLGRAWCETKKFGANIHRFLAWAVMIGSAVYIQSIWLMETGPAQPFWPPNRFWWVVSGLAMLTLFVAAMIQYKTSQLSLPGIFIICLTVGSIPLATARPDMVFAVFDAVPGLNARPGSGLIMGAAIIAAGLIWLVGGLRRGSFVNIIMGAVTIGVQAIVLLQPQRFDTDLAVVFIVSLICALCIGGLIAGASPDSRSQLTNYA